MLKADAIAKKVRQAVRKKTLPKKPLHLILDEAVEKGVISAADKATLKEAEDLRYSAIQVDDFDEDEFRAR